MQNNSNDLLDTVDTKFLRSFQKVADSFEKWTAISIFYVAQFFFVSFLFFEGIAVFSAIKKNVWLVELMFLPITIFFIVMNFKFLHRKMNEEKREGLMSVSDLFLSKIRRDLLFFMPLLLLSAFDLFFDQKTKLLFSEYSMVFSFLCRAVYFFKWGSFLLFIYFLSCKSNPPKKSLVSEKVGKVFEKNKQLQHQTVPS